MNRTLTLSPDRQSGKRAFRDLVKAFGGQEAASEETGVRRQKISDMGVPNVAEYPTLDLIDALEDRTVGLPGWPHVTSWLCRRRGGVFVPVPKVEPDARDWMTQVGAVSTEAAEIVAKLCASLADDQRVDAADISKHGLIDDAEQLVGIAVQLLTQLRTVAGGQ